MPENTSEPPNFQKKIFKKFFLKICTIQNFLKFIFVFRRPKSIRKKYLYPGGRPKCQICWTVLLHMLHTCYTSFKEPT